MTTLTATFLVLAIVFFVLGTAVKKRNRGTDSPPAAR